MTNYTPTITIDNIMDELASVISPFVESVDIIRSQVNRAAMPSGPFVQLTEIVQPIIERPQVTHNPDEQTSTIRSPKRIDVQIDMYGENSGDWCSAFDAAFSSTWAYKQFVTCYPLYTDHGREIPLITGEEQYVRRWTIIASLQYNPETTVPQQSATALSLDIFDDVDN